MERLALVFFFAYCIRIAVSICKWLTILNLLVAFLSGVAYFTIKIRKNQTSPDYTYLIALRV